MSAFKFYCGWILKNFVISDNLSIPKDIIRLIINLINIRIAKIIKNGKNIAIMHDEKIKIFGRAGESNTDLQIYINNLCLNRYPMKTNTQKIVYTKKRRMIIDADGTVCMHTQGNYLQKYGYPEFIKIEISNVENIFDSWYEVPDRRLYTYDSYDSYDSDEDVGYECFIFLTRNGNIYSCGMNANYMLGLSKKTDVKLIKPEKINLQNVVDVHVDDTYCLALTLYNELYMWGNLEDCARDLGIANPFCNLSYPRKKCLVPYLIWKN